MSAFCSLNRLLSHIFSYFWLFYMQKVNVNMEIKNYNEHLPLSPSIRGIFRSRGHFLRRICVKCSFSVILNLDLNYVRLYDVDPLCFPANRGSYRSSHLKAYFCIKKCRQEK